MNPVYIRLALYFIAPLIGMLPGVTYDAATHILQVNLDTAAVGLAGSALFTGAVFAKWGTK